MRKQVSPVSYASDNGKTNSCIRGYHVFQEHWLPIWEKLNVKGNWETQETAQYAIAVYKGDEIVGHVPR